jgi:serine/threonine protein kinase/WD40 repeat protein
MALAIADAFCQKHVQPETALGPRVADSLRCPHCGNNVRIVEDTVELHCRSCGSSFSIDPQATVIREDAGLFHDRFRLAIELGRGAFGVVYKAHDTVLDRVVAVKMPRAGTFSSRMEAARFRREAQHAAGLKHPNIVQVHNLGTAEAMYIVSEYVEGVTLDDLIGGGRVSFRETADIVRQIAAALHYAHENKVLHRDVKPSNILIDADNRPYLTDFGLARSSEPAITMTREGEVIGTPAYMAPEQAAGENEKVSVTSDVYSLGVVLYRMLSGELPFRGSQRMLLHQVMHEEPKPPRKINEFVPRDLETIALKAMQKLQSNRFQTAHEFSAELRRWLADEPIRSRPPSPPERLWKWCRRRPVLSSLLAVITTLLIAITIGSAVWASREAEHTRSAQQNLALSLVQEGLGRSSDGGPAAMLPYAIEALSLEESLGDADGERISRIRIDRILREMPRLTHVQNFEARVDTFAIDRANGLLYAAAGNKVTRISTTNLADQRQFTAASRVKSLEVNEPGTRLIIVPHGTGNVGVADTTAGQTSFAEIRDVSQGRIDIIARVNHEPLITDAAFAGQFVVTTALDGTAKVWDAETGERRRVLAQPGRLVSSAHEMSGNELLIHSQKPGDGNSSILRIYNTEDWSFFDIPHGRYMWHLSPGPTGFLTAGEGGRVREWKATDVEQSPAGVRHPGSANHGFYLRDGLILTHGNATGTTLWDPESGSQLYDGVLAGTDNEDFPFDVSKDRELFAAAGRGETIGVYWSHSGQPVCPPLPSSSRPSAIKFFDNGRFLAVGSVDGILKVWDLAGTVADSVLVSDGSDTVRAPHFSPDGDFFLLERDKELAIWDVDPLQQTDGTPSHDQSITAFGISSDSQQIATVCQDGLIKIWTRNADLKSTVQNENGAAAIVRFSPTNQRLAAGHLDGTVSIWPSTSSKPLVLKGHTEGIGCVDFDKTGLYLATGAADRTARVWDTTDGRLVSQVLEHRDEIDDVRFSPDGKLLLTTCSPWVTIWDWRSGKVVHSHRKRMSSAHNSLWKDQSSFFSIDAQGAVGLQNLAGKDLRLFPESAVERLQQSSPGVLLISCNKEARLWDTRFGFPIAPPFPYGEYGMATLSPAGDMVLTTTIDGVARLWPIEPIELDVDKLRRFSTVLTGRRREDGVVRTVNADELQELFMELCQPDNAHFVTTDKEIADWEALRKRISSK